MEDALSFGLTFNMCSSICTKHPVQVRIIGYCSIVYMFCNLFFVFVSCANKLEIDSDVSSSVVVFEIDGSLVDEDEPLWE